MIYNEYGINKKFSLIKTFVPNDSNGINGDYFSGNGANMGGATAIRNGGIDNPDIPGGEGHIIFGDVPSNQLQFNVTENYSDNDKSFNINTYYAYVTFHNYSCQYDNNYSYVSLTLHNKTTYINKNQTYFVSLSNIGIINYDDTKLWYNPNIIKFGSTNLHSAHIYYYGTIDECFNDGWFKGIALSKEDRANIPGHETQTELRTLLYDTLVYPASYYSDNIFHDLSEDNDLHKHITASYIISNINEYPSYIYNGKYKNKFNPYLNYIRDFNDNYHLYIYTYTYIANGLYTSFFPASERYGRTDFSGGSFIIHGSQKQTTTNNEYKKVTLWDLKTTHDYFSSNDKGIKRITYFISHALCEAGCSRPSNNGVYTYHLYSASINNPTTYTYHIGEFCLMESYFVNGATSNKYDGFNSDEIDHVIEWSNNKDYLKSFIYAAYNDGTGESENPHYSYIKVGLDFFLREGETILPETSIYYTDLNHKDANYRYNLALYKQYLYGYDIYNSNYIKLDDNSHIQLFSYINQLFSTVNGSTFNCFLKKTTVTSPCLFNLFLYNTYTGKTLSDSFYTKDNIKEIETVSDNTEEYSESIWSGSYGNINKISYNYNNIKETNDITYYKVEIKTTSPLTYHKIELNSQQILNLSYNDENLINKNYYFAFKSTYSYNIIPKYVERYSKTTLEHYNVNYAALGDFIAYESSKPINGIDRNIITNMNIDLYDNILVFELWYNDKVYNYGTPSEKIIPVNFYSSINTYYSDCFIANKNFNIYKPTVNNNITAGTTDCGPLDYIKMNLSKQIPLFSSYMLKEETFNNENYISAKAIIYKNDNYTIIENNNILRKIYNIYDENNKQSNIILNPNLLYDFLFGSAYNTNDIKSVTILLGVDAPVSNVKFNEESLTYIKSFYPEYIPIDEGEDKSINVELYSTYYITSYMSPITYLSYTNVDNNSYILMLNGTNVLSNQEITNIGNNLYNLNVISQDDFINTKEVKFDISNVIGEYQYVKQENKNLDTFIKFVADTPIISSSSDNIPIHIKIPQYKKEHEPDKYPL